MAEKTYDVLVNDVMGIRVYNILNVSHDYIDRLARMQNAATSLDKIDICIITEHEKNKKTIEDKL